MARALFAALALLACAPAARCATHTIVIEGMRFQPAELVVKRGDRVVWVNRDVVPHTATAGRTFDSAAIAPGATWAATLKQPGRHDYVCTMHPMMKARLTVQ